jgi:hypothetical protein
MNIAVTPKWLSLTINVFVSNPLTLPAASNLNIECLPLRGKGDLNCYRYKSFLVDTYNQNHRLQEV